MGAVWLLYQCTLLCGTSVAPVWLLYQCTPVWQDCAAQVWLLRTFCPQPRGSNERLPAPGKPPFIKILIFIFDQISNAANLLLIFFVSAFICTVLSACVFVMSFLAANFRRKYISFVLSDMIHMIKTKRDMISRMALL